MTGFSWRAIPEPELVPYQALTAVPVRSLLVLAPHPDDEVFACGGLLALAADQGVDARVAVVSDGAAAGDAAVREAESRRAAEMIGYARCTDSVTFWRLADRGVVPDAALIDRISAVTGAQGAEWLLAPSPFEVHPDHRAVALAAIAATPRTGARLGFYEVGQPLMPNLLIDITPVVARKLAAASCFASQLAIQRYEEHLTALNRYRSYTLGPQVTHAEAFWFPEPADAQDAASLQGALARMIGRRLGQRDG